jgi:uncharacterized membrane protein
VRKIRIFTDARIEAFSIPSSHEAYRKPGAAGPMNDQRYEAIESRLSALESQVRVIAASATIVPGPTSPSVAPPSVRKPKTVPKGGLEDLIAGRGLQIAGLVLVLVGAAFFIDLACTRGWLGPAERILLGLAGGSALTIFAATRIRGSYRQLAEALIGLGAGIDYLSLWAAVARFPELHVSRGAAFAAMIAVTAALGTLAGVRRSQTIASLGIAGGFLTPVLIAGGPPDRIVLASYLLTLCVGMLFVARRYEFAVVEVLAVLGALSYAASFAPGPGWTVLSAELVAALFAAAFAIAFTLGVSPSAARRNLRITLLVVDAGAYIAVLEQIFADRQTILGENLLGFAALLLLAARLPKLRGAFARTYGYVGWLL